MDAKIQRNQVRQTFTEYKSLCGDENAYVTITDWWNGEGVDVDLNEKGCESRFTMTWDQWTCLKKAMKAHLKES